MGAAIASLSLFVVGGYLGGVVCTYFYAGPLIAKGMFLKATYDYNSAKLEWRAYMKNCRLERLVGAICWASSMSEHDMMWDD